MASRPARALDIVLDRTVVPGFSRIGPALRHRWWAADPAPGSLAGRRVLVTGATSGIGRAIAEGCLGLGAAVHVLGRDAGRTAALAEALRAGHPGGEVVEEVCDVGDLDAVRAWAGGFAAAGRPLHALVHNAGVLPPERQETTQGHELTLAVHVLGPYLMTRLLTPSLAAADGATVVLMSSGGSYGSRLRDADLEFREGTYSGVRAYARTKRMQVVLAAGLAERLAPLGIQVESTHPGWVDTDGVSGALPGFGRVMRPLLRTPEQGADTTVWLVATRPPSTGSRFWHDRAQRPSTFGWERPEDPAKVARFVAGVAAAAGEPWP